MIRGSRPLLLAGVFATVLLASSANGQKNPAQNFRVAVPARLSVNVPSQTVRLRYDGGHGDLAFPLQTWQAQTNVIHGATITFATNHAFWRTDEPGAKCDARLTLSLASADAQSGWRVTNPSDQTNYAAAVERATVKATSSRPGAGTFDLTVTLIANPTTPMASGDYQLTVTATLIAN